MMARTHTKIVWPGLNLRRKKYCGLTAQKPPPLSRRRVKRSKTPRPSVAFFRLISESASRAPRRTMVAICGLTAGCNSKLSYEKSQIKSGYDEAQTFTVWAIYEGGLRQFPNLAF